jgi:hypothetical protein
MNMMKFLAMHFTRRIVIDVSPTRFTFTCPKRNYTNSVTTSVYMKHTGSKYVLTAVGEEAAIGCRSGPDIQRIEVFNFAEPLPAGANFTRDILIEALFEFGLGKVYEKTVIPEIRPVVYIHGAERFQDRFDNPREKLGALAKDGGAMVVIFDENP